MRVDDANEQGATQRRNREAELAGNLFKYAVHAEAYQARLIHIPSYHDGSPTRGWP